MCQDTTYRIIFSSDAHINRHKHKILNIERLSFDWNYGFVRDRKLRVYSRSRTQTRRVWENLCEV